MLTIGVRSGWIGVHDRRQIVPREELLAPITVDPNVCFGKPCVRGHRIWVSLILDLLARGMSIPEVLDDYHIEDADVLACIAYGAEMARERYVAVHEVAS
jgi:uncharacterized protein (DUF433 family)